MSLYFKLGWRNLWRNKRRSAIELTSIAGGVFLALAFNNLTQGSYAQMIEEAVKMGSGHIGLYHTAYLAERRTEQVLLPDTYLHRLEQLDGVAGVYPRLYVPGLVRSGHGSRPAAVMGIDPERATTGSPLFRRDIYVAGQPLGVDQHGTREIPAVIGVELARDLGLTLNRKFVWMAQDINGHMISHLLRVAGIIETGLSEIDRGSVIADRAVISAAIGQPGAAHEVALMLPNQDAIGRALPMVRDVMRDAPDIGVYPWQEAMPALANALRMDYAGLQFVIGFIYLLVGVGTINTMLMSVMERSREFGIVRSLGLRPSGVRKMVLAEALVLSLVGVTIGTLLAVAAGIYLINHGIDLSGMFGDTGVEFAGTLMEPVIYSTWDFSGMLLFAGVMVAVAIAAAFYPAHRALKSSPADAMRRY